MPRIGPRWTMELDPEAGGMTAGRGAAGSRYPAAEVWR